MRVEHAPLHRLHDPKHEVQFGIPVPTRENPARAPRDPRRRSMLTDASSSALDPASTSRSRRRTSCWGERRRTACAGPVSGQPCGGPDHGPTPPIRSTAILVTYPAGGPGIGGNVTSGPT
jgi:hypothetical protein